MKDGPPSTFMRKGELCRELQIDRKTLDRRVADGSIPPPWSRIGPTVAIWRRRDFEYFVQNRCWPKEAFLRGDL